MQRTKQKRESSFLNSKFRNEWGVFSRFRHRKVHRQIKDRLFRFLFEKDKEALLQLYNALNGTDYQDASELQVVTIESAVYIVMKNDLAFVIAGTLNLYEHQSTYNPNMPVRFLIYLAKEYQKLMELAEQSIYGTTLISLPTPRCIVFYNGEREVPEEQIFRLSDAFSDKKEEADIELKVRMLNISYGHNRELMEKCRVLEEYAKFVSLARHYIAEEKEMQKALDMAIDYCIDHNILSGFLRRYRVEVLGMMLEEFDAGKYERTLRAEGKEEGRQEGAERVNKLTYILIEQNRIADLKRSAQEPEYQEQLLKEFDL